MAFSDLVRLKLKELEEPRFDAALSGAHQRAAGKISPGYNLVDGVLIDVEGCVIKNWKSRYLGILLPGGRYVAQERYESRKWGMYTFDDKTLWEMDFPIHHDIVLTPAGTIITLTKEMHEYKGRKVDFCVVVEFDLEGRELSRWSTWENLGTLQKYHRRLELDRPRVFFLPEPPGRKTQSPWGGHYDYYRLNSLQVLPQTQLGLKDRRFKEGNWLISFRHGSMMFTLDGDTKEVAWKCIAGDVPGCLEGQHSPAMLPDGRVLLFDNGRYRGWSRVLELDPVGLKITWEYRAPDFYTLSQGHVQKLPNGNLLVTESEKGRAFELTPDKDIVWEYYHPQVQDESNSMHPESFGRRQWIYRMVRYPPEFFNGLM
jgi:hypothetical protein